MYRCHSQRRLVMTMTVRLMWLRSGTEVRPLHYRRNFDHRAKDTTIASVKVVTGLAGPAQPLPLMPAKGRRTNQEAGGSARPCPFDIGEPARADGRWLPGEVKLLRPEARVPG